MNPTRRRIERLERTAAPAGPDVIRVEAPGGTPAFEMRRQADGSWQHGELKHDPRQ
jgi:hypothetical protein